MSVRSISREFCGFRKCRSNLIFDPGVGASQPLLQRYLRLPAQHLPETGVIGVAPPHPLRTFDRPFGDAEAGNLEAAAQAKIGTRQQLIIDQVYPRESRRFDAASAAKGRSRGDTPEIDGEWTWTACAHIAATSAAALGLPSPVDMS